jgi:hypothetical protein
VARGRPDGLHDCWGFNPAAAEVKSLPPLISRYHPTRSSISGRVPDIAGRTTADRGVPVLSPGRRRMRRTAGRTAPVGEPPRRHRAKRPARTAGSDASCAFVRTLNPPSSIRQVTTCEARGFMRKPKLMFRPTGQPVAVSSGWRRGRDVPDEAGKNASPRLCGSDRTDAAPGADSRNDAGRQWCVASITGFIGRAQLGRHCRSVPPEPKVTLRGQSGPRPPLADAPDAPRSSRISKAKPGAWRKPAHGAG